MILNQLRCVRKGLKIRFPHKYEGFGALTQVRSCNAKALKENIFNVTEKELEASKIACNRKYAAEVFPSPRVVPMVVTSKEFIILPFDEVPGPKSLKYLSNVRHYLTEIGTQLTAGVLTFGLNVGTYINTRKPLKYLSVLFDEYGPVVRFVSPMGGDIVLINHPDHIQKVYTVEGDYPVRSSLESLEKYRIQHRNHVFGGLYSAQGLNWSRQRSVVYTPINNSIAQHAHAINDVCETLCKKIYTNRNHHDEMKKDMYKELHKWAYDCLGLIMFSKQFKMLETDIVSSQCDMSWLYHSLERATDAIIKCESGWHLWKLVSTPAWRSLVKHCDDLDNLIGKHVIEAEQDLPFPSTDDEPGPESYSLIRSMLMSEEKMTPEDITTVLMDMLLIGVNTITSSMSFILYYLAKYGHTQKKLYEEIAQFYSNVKLEDMSQIKHETPYLQACIKEALRLAPPIPVLTRILPRNVILDKYNIPRGTLIIMSTLDASMKESNYEEATKYCPERWLKSEGKDYHSFASVPFGFGARKCLGQNVAETMISLLTIQLLQKYKLEYHYGDIQPTRSFISKPNKPLKIRFVDRF